MATQYTADRHALPYPDGQSRVAVHDDVKALAVKAGIGLGSVEAIAAAAVAETRLVEDPNNPGMYLIGSPDVAQPTLVNVGDYGALDAVDSFAAVKEAYNATPEGGVLFFPPGHYWTAYRDPEVESNWLTVDKSVTFMGQPGSVILENFLIYVKGGYGPFLNVGVGATTGDQEITTTTAHGMVAGDYVQLLSQVNAYTADAGEWQLGSANPTTGVLEPVRFSEIHRVSTATATTAGFDDLIVYPFYGVSTAGQDEPITGVTVAQVRQLHTVSPRFEGLMFTNTVNDYFRTFIIRAASNVVFSHCGFESGAPAGGHVRMTDCFNTRFEQCWSSRTLDTWSGSAWNTFLPGGGCHGTTFDGCRFVGEAQTVDFTPNTMINSAADIGAAPDAAGSWLTCQFNRIINSGFRNCGASGTTHPGTYLFEYKNNLAHGGSNGPFARSKASIITDNTIHTSRRGIVLSGFHRDSVAADNTIVQIPSALYADYWIGIVWHSTSSDLITGSTGINPVIRDNDITCATPYATNSGIEVGHMGDYAALTDDLKNNLGAVQVTGNRLNGCSIVNSSWINGTLIRGNTFRGGSDRSHYIISQDDAAANMIDNNTFLDQLVGTISVGTVTLAGHGYDTTTRVGVQHAPYADGYLMYSPDYAPWRVTVANDGTLSAAAA